MTEKPETVYDIGSHWLQRVEVPGGWLYILQYTPTAEGEVISVTMTFVPKSPSEPTGTHLDAEDLYDLTRRNRG